MPDAFMFIQMSHALCYLVFTAQVDLNREMAAGKGTKGTHPCRRTGLIYGLSILRGPGIFFLPETYVISLTLQALIAINIHHSYTGSAICKMRNAGVRQQLFDHLIAR